MKQAGVMIMIGHIMESRNNEAGDLHCALIGLITFYDSKHSHHIGWR